VEAVGCSKVHPNLENINLNHDGTVCADPPHSPLIENLNGSEERLPTESEIDAGFQVFWRQYPRAVHQGKARTEYRKAIRSGKVTIVQIQHAAMLYAAARWEANQDHYTLPAAKWLAEECWGDDPRAHALGARNGWTRSQMARMAECSAENERLAEQARARAREAAERAAAPPSPPDPRWTKIREVLRAEIGEKDFGRFFSETEFEAIEFGAVRLRTPAPYDAREIKKRFGDVLLKLWKAENENVQSVAVLVGGIHMRRTG
jgi:hypothetical protein